MGVRLDHYQGFQAQPVDHDVAAAAQVDPSRQKGGPAEPRPGQVEHDVSAARCSWLLLAWACAAGTAGLFTVVLPDLEELPHLGGVGCHGGSDAAGRREVAAQHGRNPPGPAALLADETGNACGGEDLPEHLGGRRVDGCLLSADERQQHQPQPQHPHDGDRERGLTGGGVTCGDDGDAGGQHRAERDHRADRGDGEQRRRPVWPGPLLAAQHVPELVGHRPCPHVCWGREEVGAEPHSGRWVFR